MYSSMTRMSFLLQLISCLREETYAASRALLSLFFSISASMCSMYLRYFFSISSCYLSMRSISSQSLRQCTEDCSCSNASLLCVEFCQGLSCGCVEGDFLRRPECLADCREILLIEQALPNILLQLLFVICHMSPHITTLKTSDHYTAVMNGNQSQIAVIIVCALCYTILPQKYSFRPILGTKGKRTFQRFLCRFAGFQFCAMFYRRPIYQRLFIFLIVLFLAVNLRVALRNEELLYFLRLFFGRFALFPRFNVHTEEKVVTVGQLSHLFS